MGHCGGERSTHTDLEEHNAVVDVAAAATTTTAEEADVARNMSGKFCIDLGFENKVVSNYTAAHVQYLYNDAVYTICHTVLIEWLN